MAHCPCYCLVAHSDWSILVTLVTPGDRRPSAHPPLSPIFFSHPRRCRPGALSRPAWPDQTPSAVPLPSIARQPGPRVFAAPHTPPRSLLALLQSAALDVARGVAHTGCRHRSARAVHACLSRRPYLLTRLSGPPARRPPVHAASADSGCTFPPRTYACIPPDIPARHATAR